MTTRTLVPIPVRLDFDALAPRFSRAMGGLDALIFTGGIGENSATVRALATKDLEFLGVRVDPVANLGGKGDRLISYDDAAVKVAVLATNEEIIVGRETAALLTSI